MSGGTPVQGGYMRQRYNQGYASSGDDVEDDASSRTPSFAPVSNHRTWIQVMETVLWIASAVFIFYFGDGNSNLMNILYHDDRIKRIPLYVGLVGILLNLGIIMYTKFFTWDFRKADDKWETLPPSTAQVVALFGLLSFSMFSFSLWPIWRFLTFPLLITLFMAVMAISPSFPIGTWMGHEYTFRTD